MNIESENRDEAQSAVEDDLEEVPYRQSSARHVQIQPYDYSVRTLMDMVADEDIILNPDYQRHYRWDNKKASRFIESLILNIPVPVVYLNEEEDGRYSVIDGQQRLTSLLRFTRPNEIPSTIDAEPLKLEGLKLRSDLANLNYYELPQKEKRNLQKKYIRCIAILNETDATLKYEVFERLNTGSAELTNQEIRNYMYRGKLNDLLNETSKNIKFQELISLPVKSQRTMKDSELILRFLAFRELSPNYHGNYSEYLNEFMEEHRNPSHSRIEKLKQLINGTIENLYTILGPGIAFRKPLDRQDPKEWSHTRINGAIYESQMIAFSRLPPFNRIPNDTYDSLKKNTYKAFQNNDYWGSLFQGTARKKHVTRRTEILIEYLNEVELV